MGKTIQEIADHLGCSVEEAERELQGLIDLGLVEQIDTSDEVSPNVQRVVISYIHNTWLPEWMPLSGQPGWTWYANGIIVARSIGRGDEFIKWVKENRPFETVSVPQE